MKLCVVMWFNNDIKEYAEINYIINKKYCNNYGYDIIKSNEQTTSRSVVWERIPLVIKHLSNYDYVMYIDSDAIFLKDSPPITNLIECHSEKLFILSNDIDDIDNKVNENINAGVFIVKNNPISYQILDKWYNEPQGNDQETLRYMVENNLLKIKEYSVLIPYGTLQNFPQCPQKNDGKYGLTHKAFILHLAGNNKEKRTVFSKSYLKYNFSDTCKCGFKKDKNKLTCCLLCHKYNQHGPYCKKINNI